MGRGGAPVGGSGGGSFSTECERSEGPRSGANHRRCQRCQDRPAPTNMQLQHASTTECCKVGRVGGKCMIGCDAVMDSATYTQHAPATLMLHHTWILIICARKLLIVCAKIKYSFVFFCLPAPPRESQGPQPSKDNYKGVSPETFPDAYLYVQDRKQNRTTHREETPDFEARQLKKGQLKEKQNTNQYKKYMATCNADPRNT
jgi:hypothetical protein